MSRRVHPLITYLRAEDAYTIVEFLDQLREVLLQAYGDDIRTMLQEARPESRTDDDDEEEF